MEIQNLETEDERTSKFVLRGASPAFANGLRRSMVGEVPTLAIDEVDIYENNSVMFDEVLSLRLGLIPLTTDLESYSVPEECDCGGEGCTNCEVSLTIDVEAEDDDRTVYSSDLESSDPEVQPADGNIPIIDLKPGQALIVECTARLGKGKEHAKNQGGVSVGYKHLQRIVEDGEYEEDTVRGVVETPDGDLLDLSEHGNSLDEAFDGDVGVEDITDAFVFRVESDGSLPPEELVERAAESISSRADKLRDRVTA